MAKTKKELEEIKSRVEELSVVLQELSEEELNEVLGGAGVLDSMGAALMGSYEESCPAYSGSYDESCVVISAVARPRATPTDIAPSIPE